MHSNQKHEERSMREENEKDGTQWKTNPAIKVEESKSKEHKPTNFITKQINKLIDLDHKLSHWLHQKDHLAYTAVLYPFAAFFHPGLIWVAYISIYLISNFSLRTTAIYALGTLICLITIFFLKKLTKRSRPPLNEKVKKPHHFRKKEKNHSMPSGDAIQSALFVTFLYYLGGDWRWITLFHMGVCIGRVYYMCHWIADTLVSTVLGTLIGIVVYGVVESSHWLNFLNDFEL